MTAVVLIPTCIVSCRRARFLRLEVGKDGWAVRAESALLEVFEGGCAVPVGMWSTWRGGNISFRVAGFNFWFSALSLKSVITSMDGSREITVETMGVVTSVEEALELGKRTATSLSMEKGGHAIIADLRAERLRKTQLWQPRSI